MKKRIHFNLTTPEGRLRFYQSTLWRDFRRAQLSEHPWCVRCRKRHQVTPAGELHHVIPLVEAPDRALDPTNTEGLCKPCHSRETAKENR